MKLKYQGKAFKPDKPNLLPIKLKKIHLIIIAFYFCVMIVILKKLLQELRNIKMHIYAKTMLVLSS